MAGFDRKPEAMNSATWGRFRFRPREEILKLSGWYAFLEMLAVYEPVFQPLGLIYILRDVLADDIPSTVQRDWKRGPYPFASPH